MWSLPAKGFGSGDPSPRSGRTGLPKARPCRCRPNGGQVPPKPLPRRPTSPSIARRWPPWLRAPQRDRPRLGCRVGRGTPVAPGDGRRSGSTGPGRSHRHRAIPAPRRRSGGPAAPPDGPVHTRAGGTGWGLAWSTALQGQWLDSAPLASSGWPASMSAASRIRQLSQIPQALSPPL